MFKDMTELAENKLLLLYIFCKLDMQVSNSCITQIILENNLINYFTLQQYLSELIESGFIKLFKEGRHSYLSLTDMGQETLKFFNNRIPSNKKEIVDEYLDKNYKKAKDTIRVISEFEPKGDKDFVVTLKLNKGEKNLLEIKLPALTREEAKDMCGKLKEKSDALYKNIIELINVK